MNRFPLLVALSLPALAFTASASAEETLDTLLPPPFWFRSHADELNVDAQTKQRIETLYYELEPEYHKLKAEVEKRTQQLYEKLTADELDEAAIVNRMQSLLEAENALKLYQVHVRITLLSQVSAEQRRQARQLAKRQPEPNVQKVLESKVERIRALAARVKEKGGSIEESQRKLQAAEKTIAAGKVVEGARMLDGIIRGLEEKLGRKGKEK